MNDPSPTPPGLATKFLCLFLKVELQEEVLGDLEEQFWQNLESGSVARAQRRYWYQVLRYIRPFALKTSVELPYNYTTMYRNYVKIAWRNLLRHKLYSFIKIGGFALGIAACFLITLYIRDELSYDTHYPDGERIYRLISISNSPEFTGKWVAFPPPILEVLTHDFPAIEQAGRLIPFNFFDAGSNQVTPQGSDKSTYQEGFAYADQGLLDILQIPMVYGDRSKALSQPNTAVISEKVAEKYFPGENPVGKTILLNDNSESLYSIGAVMEDFPASSHLTFEIFLTLTEKEFWPGEQTSWGSSNYCPYIKLRPGISPQEMEEKLLAIRDDYMVPYMRERGDQRAEEAAAYYRIGMQALTDIHLNSADIFDILPHGDIDIIWLFGVIAVVILVLALINFVNLSTAKSANRAKEVGLRKVIGSQRKNLVRQFLTESVLFSLISFMLGMGLASILLPYFNRVSGKSLDFPYQEWWLLPVLLGAIFLVGVLAGLYPAFYLSRFSPIQVLKGEIRKGIKGSFLQNSLVVFQFTTSVLLIIGAFVVNHQMQFMLNKKLGYEKEQVLLIQGANTLGERLSEFQDELANLSQIHSTSATDFLPVDNTQRDGNSWWKEGNEKKDKGVPGQKWRVDHRYISTLGMKVVEGRNFSPEIAADSQAILLNQTMVQKLGLENPLGARISNGFEPPYQVIGVVEDFHFESMKGEIRPLSLVLGQRGSFVAAKLKTADMGQSLASISAIWDQFMPNQSFRYTFLDDRFTSMYVDIERTSQIFASFAILAVMVACLGLFALSAFTAEQRRKEISIRKILGASFQNLFSLMTSSFLKLVAISLVLAIPLGWYMMQDWLGGFAYRISLSWEIFALAGGIILVIALATISYESIRVTRVNPVESLQSE